MRTMAEKMKFPNGSVIIVDGTETPADEIKAAFEDTGYEALVCKDSKRAFRLLDIRSDDWTPTLVMVDMILPDISGYEIIRRMSERLGSKQVPIVMMSKYMTAEDKLEASNAGAHKLVEKPITVDTVEHCLEDKKMKEMRSKVGEMVFKIDYS